MLRDSFTSHLAPFVSEHFRRAVYLWQRSFDYEAIERERPDVVIEEFGERMLSLLPPVDPAGERYELEAKFDIAR
jgi:hypothetical protein